jgi:hypothetical protein
MKKLLIRAGQINHTHVLTAFFLVVVFTICFASFIWVMGNITNILENENEESQRDVKELSVAVIDELRSILAFRSRFPTDREDYINLNGFMARVIGQRYMNQRVRLDNGHLAHVARGMKHDISIAAQQISRLYEEQTERDKDFLFVLAPTQVPNHEDILPVGFEYYSHLNSDELLYALRSNNVPVLDLRDELVKDGICYTEAFFKTDHHWTPETGFWAYVKITEHLVQSGVIEPVAPGYTDINEFNVNVYESWFLGSAGERTGKYFAGVDDFSVIFPKFETRMSVEIPSISISKQGDFSVVGYNHDELYYDLFNANPFRAYGHGWLDHKHYGNELAPTDIKVSFIGDSFSNVPALFLSLIAKYLDDIDMRYYKGNFEEYYNDFDPDVIILMVYANNTTDDNTTYEFFGDLSG